MFDCCCRVLLLVLCLFGVDVVFFLICHMCVVVVVSVLTGCYCFVVVEFVVVVLVVVFVVVGLRLIVRCVSFYSVCCGCVGCGCCLLFSELFKSLS